jgi:hypothetical protein
MVEEARIVLEVDATKAREQLQRADEEIEREREPAEKAEDRRERIVAKSRTIERREEIQKREKEDEKGIRFRLGIGRIAQLAPVIAAAGITLQAGLATVGATLQQAGLDFLGQTLERAGAGTSQVINEAQGAIAAGLGTVELMKQVSQAFVAQQGSAAITHAQKQFLAQSGNRFYKALKAQEDFKRVIEISSDRAFRQTIGRSIGQYVLGFGGQNKRTP